MRGSGRRHEPMVRRTSPCIFQAMPSFVPRLSHHVAVQAGQLVFVDVRRDPAKGNIT